MFHCIWNMLKHVVFINNMQVHQKRNTFLVFDNSQAEDCSRAWLTLQSAPSNNDLFYSPIKAAENGGHAHHHIGNWESIGCIFASKLLDLQSCDLIPQKQFVGAVEETWDRKTLTVTVCLFRYPLPWFIKLKLNAKIPKLWGDLTN